MRVLARMESAGSWSVVWLSGVCDVASDWEPGMQRKERAQSMAPC